jgi:hypothetical protein
MCVSVLSKLMLNLIDHDVSQSPNPQSTTTTTTINIITNTNTATDSHGVGRAMPVRAHADGFPA